MSYLRNLKDRWITLQLKQVGAEWPCRFFTVRKVKIFPISLRLHRAVKQDGSLVPAKLSISFKENPWQGFHLHILTDITESPSWRTEKNIGLNSRELGGCGEVQLHWDTIHAIKKKWANKINEDRLHCGVKGLNRGQHKTIS